MNVAFPAVLMIILISPGLIFSRSFFQMDDLSLIYVPFTNKATVGIFATIVIHIVLVLIVYAVGYEINFKEIFVFISGAHGEIYANAIKSISPMQVAGFIIYLVVAYSGAFFLGNLCRRGIKKFKLDKKFRWLRLDNPWYYLFAGQDYGEQTEPDGVRIAATADIAGKCYLFIGYLNHYFFDRDGNIDRLILTDAMRREIENDKCVLDEKTIEERCYPIDGHYFVLKYSEIKNLNVQFLWMENEKDISVTSNRDISELT